MLEIGEEGTEPGYPFGWDYHPSSPARCKSCAHIGQLAEFTVQR